MDKQQEPRLRFKGFAEAWKKKVLGELGYCFSGIGFPENEQGRENGIPFFKVSDMNLSGNEIYLRKANNYVTQEQIDKQRWQVIQQLPCIFFAKIGAALLLNRKRLVCNPFLLDNNTMAFILSLNLDDYFIKTLFDTIDLPALAQIGALPSISAKDIEKNIVFIPTAREQTHLGLFFRRLDSQIAESRAVLEKSRQLKKAMLAKMFPANGEKIPKIRFKGFEGEWRECKLGAFGKATSGTSLESEFCEDGNYKVINIGSYSEKSTYTDQGIRTHKNDKTEKRILNKNDLTMILNDKTSSGRIIGRVLLIDQNDTYVYNQRTQRIEIDQEHFIPLFLYHLLNADNMRQKIIYSAQGNTQVYVNWSGIKNLEYLIPPTKAEQTAIGNFFRQLDETIALQSAEVEKLNQLKKGLLAAMLV